MLNLKSFAQYLIEGTQLAPSELKKPATGGPNSGTARTEILANKIRKQEPLTLAKGGEFLVTDTTSALAAIEQFKKDGKVFKLIGKGGSEISISDLLKTPEFGGGAGAGGGTASTAVGESAQCVWMAAMLDIGAAMPIESFTDKVLTKAFGAVSVGKTSIKEILAIDESWKVSSYLCAQYAIKNRIIEKGMTFHRDDALMKAIYAAKNAAFKNNDFKPLPDDKWNPGDIWVADSDFSVREISTTTVEDMNDDILDLYLQKRLVGISLKKVEKSTKAVEKNVSRPPETEDYQFTAGHIKAVQRGEWYTSKANYITHQSGQLDIRDNNAFGTHKVEIKGKGARGGGASWGVLSDAAKRIYGVELPKTSAMKKEAALIASGDKKSMAKFAKLLQTIDKQISDKEVVEKLNDIGKNAGIWIHGKLGGLYVLNLIASGGVKANKFITQIINYAGSSTSDSSSYVILKEK